MVARHTTHGVARSTKDTLCAGTTELPHYPPFSEKNITGILHVQYKQITTYIRSQDVQNNEAQPSHKPGSCLQQTQMGCPSNHDMVWGVCVCVCVCVGGGVSRTAAYHRVCLMRKTQKAQCYRAQPDYSQCGQCSYPHSSVV